MSLKKKKNLSYSLFEVEITSRLESQGLHKIQYKEIDKSPTKWGKKCLGIYQRKLSAPGTLCFLSPVVVFISPQICLGGFTLQRGPERCWWGNLVRLFKDCTGTARGSTSNCLLSLSKCPLGRRFMKWASLWCCLVLEAFLGRPFRVKAMYQPSYLAFWSAV